MKFLYYCYYERDKDVIVKILMYPNYECQTCTTTIKADQLTCQGGEWVGDVTSGFFFFENTP